MLADYLRIFDNKWDTLWWFGENYHNQYGNVWPHAGKDPPKGYVYPSKTGFQVVLICAVLLTVLRFIFERIIAHPIGIWMGLKDRQRGLMPEPNECLEKLVRKSNLKIPKSEDMKIAARQLDVDQREVERWVRRKLQYVLPSKLTKFKESVWRFCFYTLAFGYGLYILVKEEFFWDTRLCWVGYPQYTWAMKESIFTYYVLEAAFYCSLMFSQVFDTKRKDFWEMFIHHIATLVLISLSYFQGTYRIGALVMVTHDIADIFLEIGKCCLYTRKFTASNILFGFFATSFFLSRLVFFPFRILFSAIFECIYMVPNMPCHGLFIIFLCTLQVLHIWWFGLLVKLIAKLVQGDKLEKDSRSEDETPPSSSMEEDDKKDQ